MFDRLWKGRRIERMWKGHRIDRLWKGRRIERIWRDHRKVVLAGGAVVVVVALLGTGLLLASTGKASVTPAPSIAARVATASPTFFTRWPAWPRTASTHSTTGSTFWPSRTKSWPCTMIRALPSGSSSAQMLMRPPLGVASSALFESRHSCSTSPSNR